jgi:translation initiation factor 1
MAREPRRKIEVNPAQTGLNAAFSALSSEHLDLASFKAPEAPKAIGGAGAPPTNRPAHGRVVLRREKAGRAGKTVVVVSGFDSSHDDAFIETMARTLRAECGCGGTVRDRSIEIQGDQPARIRAALERAAFRVVGP